MNRAAESCARELLETVPVVIKFIRDQVRRRRTAGLSLPQFRTLAFLNRARNSSLSAVAGHLGLSLPAMSRLINGLVEGGLVRRQTVMTNRRQIALTLTARGRATVETVHEVIRLRLAEALNTLTATEQKGIHRAMLKLHNVFGRQPAIEGKAAGSEP